MPNWACGNIRIRGKAENVKHFLENEILVEGVYIKNGKRENYEVKPDVIADIDEGYFEILSPYTGTDHPDVKIIDQYYYINGSKRNFIALGGNQCVVCSDMLYTYEDDGDDGDEIVVLFGEFSAAWSVDGSFYVDLAVKYWIDFHIFVWERGMEFSQDIEVLRDGTYTERLPDVHDDWAWKAVHPEYGG